MRVHIALSRDSVDAVARRRAKRRHDRAIARSAKRHSRLRGALRLHAIEIVVEKGTTIEFHLTSDDTDHGFRIIGTDVNAEIPKRRRGETVVKYVADTAGTFVIECSRPCGAGHTAMRATLVVK